MTNRRICDRAPRQGRKAAHAEGGIPPVVVPVPRNDSGTEEQGEEVAELCKEFGSQRCTLVLFVLTRLTGIAVMLRTWQPVDSCLAGAINTTGELISRR